jgi:hypothetical protein
VKNKDLKLFETSVKTGVHYESKPETSLYQENMLLKSLAVFLIHYYHSKAKVKFRENQEKDKRTLYYVQVIANAGIAGDRKCPPTFSEIVCI